MLGGPPWRVQVEAVEELPARGVLDVRADIRLVDLHRRDNPTISLGDAPNLFAHVQTYV